MISRRAQFVAAVAPLAAGVSSFAALAQVTPPVVSPPTREEIQRQPIEPVQPRRGRLQVEGDIERAPCPLADPQFQNVTFTLSDVQFNNLQTIPPELLRPAYANLVGQTLPIATVCDIRDRAATILRAEGYLAAVQVPPQRIENGVVRFDVLLAKVVRIQVRGDAGRSERLIAGYLSRITEQPVFNIREAERYLLLSRDIPGFDVRLTLRPAGTVPGEVIGEVAVLRTPVELDINVQNYGSRDTGRWGGQARVSFNGLTGMGDRTTLGFFTTADFKEQQVVQLGHSFKVGREGLTILGDFTYAWTDPTVRDADGDPLDLNSETLVATLEAQYPFLRTQTENWFGAIGFDYIDQDTTFGDIHLNEDKLRVAYLRLAFDSVDAGSLISTAGYSLAEPRWRAGGVLELRHGLDIFGATTACAERDDLCLALPNPSRAAGDPTAFVARYVGFLEYRPTPKFTLAVSPRAQWAPDPLLSYEEFSAGNYTAGRGYDPGVLIGDSGLGAQIEARIGSMVPRTRDSFAVQPYAFFDAAVIWNEDFQLVDPDPQELYSVGGGVRAAFGDRARLDVGVAVPLKRAGFQTERGDVRVLVSLTAKLIPWSR